MSFFSCSNTEKNDLQQQNSVLIDRLAQKEKHELVNQSILYHTWHAPLGNFYANKGGQKMQISEILKDQAKLVFRFSDADCSTCLDYGLAILKEFERTFIVKKNNIFCSLERIVRLF